MSDLDAFFGTMASFLNGRLSSAAVEQRLGASPSGQARLDVYPRLVAGDIALILELVFPAVKRAMDGATPGQWHRTVHAYWAAHPADHWDWAKYAERLPEFLAADDSLPPYLHELADFHHTRYLCAVAPQPAAGPAIDRTIFVRQYTHNTPQYALSDDPHVPLPTLSPTIVIIYQSLHTRRAEALYPSLHTLLALAERTQTSPELRANFAQLGAAAVAEGEAVLVTRGVLPARA